MAVTQLDLARQGKAGTLTDAQISASAAIALSKLAEAVIQADGGQAFTAAQSMGGFALTNLLDPVNPQDAATRAWVLTQIAGVSFSGITARAATTANITRSGTQTIDGVALSVGNIALVKNQTAQAENGAFTVAAGAWTRVPGMDAWAEVPGTLVSVQQGTVNGDTLWLSTADTGGTLDTTAITFMQLPGPSDLLAGAGMTRTGQTLDVVAADGSITVGANDIAVTFGAPAASAVGDSAVTGTAASSAHSDHKHAREAFATPAVVLGSAAAAGAATTLMRSDATIAAFDATAPAASAPADTAAVGSIAFAARRDHRHARETVITRETPGGTINGSNTTFTLANTPTAGTEQVFLNGVLQRPGAGNDYTISGLTITYLAAPLTGDFLVVSYRF